MSRTETVVLMESAPIGMIRILHPVVPFAKCGRRVTSLGKGVANRPFVQVHSFATSGSAIHAAAWMIATGQKFGTRRRADRANKKTIKASTLFRETVNVWRTEIPISVEAQVSPSLIVSQNDNDVWPVGLLSLSADNRVEGRNKR
jgi:hypothetical protein